MNEKQEIIIYAKTRNPEFYEYSWYNDKIRNNPNLIIVGGEHFNSYNESPIEDIDNLYEAYDSFDFENWLKEDYNNSWKAILNDYLKKDNKRAFSNKEISIIKETLKTRNKRNLRLVCLNLIKHTPYIEAILCGSCQGDMVLLYAPRNTTREEIDWLEAWYWGTGIEIEIHEEDTIPTCAEEVQGHTFYTNYIFECQLQEIIKKECGYEYNSNVKIVLWKFEGYSKIEKYKKSELK